MWPGRVCGGGGGDSQWRLLGGLGSPCLVQAGIGGRKDPPGKLTVGDVDAGRNAGASEGENVHGIFQARVLEWPSRHRQADLPNQGPSRHRQADLPNQGPSLHWQRVLYYECRLGSPIYPTGVLKKSTRGNPAFQGTLGVASREPSTVSHFRTEHGTSLETL